MRGKNRNELQKSNPYLLRPRMLTTNSTWREALRVSWRNLLAVRKQRGCLQLCAVKKSITKSDTTFLELKGSVLHNSLYQIRNSSLQKLFLQFLNTPLSPERKKSKINRRLKQSYNGYCYFLKVRTFAFSKETFSSVILEVVLWTLKKLGTMRQKLQCSFAKPMANYFLKNRILNHSYRSRLWLAYSRVLNDPYICVKQGNQQKWLLPFFIPFANPTFKWKLLRRSTETNRFVINKMANFSLTGPDRSKWTTEYSCRKELKSQLPFNVRPYFPKFLA